MRTVSYEFLMKPEESAECHQTLSPQVGSGHETTHPPSLSSLQAYPEFLITYRIMNPVNTPGSKLKWLILHHATTNCLAPSYYYFFLSVSLQYLIQFSLYTYKMVDKKILAVFMAHTRLYNTKVNWNLIAWGSGKRKRSSILFSAHQWAATAAGALNMLPRPLLRRWRPWVHCCAGFRISKSGSTVCLHTYMHAVMNRFCWSQKANMEMYQCSCT